MIHRSCAALAVALSLALLGCKSSAPVSAAAATPTEQPGALAPFPYTAEQLRAAFPVGRTLRYDVVEQGRPGSIETRFIDVNADSATMATTLRDGDGKAIGEPQRSTTKWTELVAHASYPAATTAIEDVTIDTPSGKHAGTKYVVRRPDENGRPSVTIVYFDAERAGPPVKMLVEVDGVIVQQLTLVGDQVAP